MYKLYILARKNLKKIFLIFFAFSIMLACDNNEELVKPNNLSLQVGANSFTFTEYLPFENKPIEVFYFIPEDANPNSPILFSLHGMNRNGFNHRNSLISKANQHKFIVIVPEFNDDYFTGGDGYNLANIFVDGDNPSTSTLNPNDEWTFAVLDPLFVYIKSLITNYSNSYHLIGFSAGGQLAHRTFIFNNSSYCNKTVAMSSGWYTTIDLSLDFPYGLKESPFDSINLATIFAKELIILVGENDNDPNDPNLRRNSIVDDQGDNRLDRADYFFANANNLAIEENLNFNWQKFIVPNAAHSLTPVSNFAIDLLYQ